MTQQDDFDFGFSAVSEEDLKAMERELERQVAAKDTASKTYEEKLTALHAMIMPLLNNLAKDDDNKEYIHWPDRQKKMKAFISKINKLMND
jgi:hypothetical protein